MAFEQNSHEKILKAKYPQYGEKDDIAEISINEEDLKLIPKMVARVNEQIKARFGD